MFGSYHIFLFRYQPAHALENIFYSAMPQNNKKKSGFFSFILPSKWESLSLRSPPLFSVFRRSKFSQFLIYLYYGLCLKFNRLNKIIFFLNKFLPRRILLKVLNSKHRETEQKVRFSAAYKLRLVINLSLVLPVHLGLEL